MRNDLEGPGGGRRRELCDLDLERVAAGAEKVLPIATAIGLALETWRQNKG